MHANMRATSTPAPHDLTPMQVALLLWAYLATFAANPGLVPPGWQPFELDEVGCLFRAVGIPAGEGI